jgi:ribosomal protein S18 acetylase RimI-like enzyme
MVAREASFAIRAARPSDKRAVGALCARIWEDDYIADAFDDWVRDRTGRLWVAVERGRVIGVAKLTVRPSGESWLHGLRVDPEYRRRGVATALLEHRIARARRLGAGVARLDTAQGNVAVQRLMQSHRFGRIARVGSYWASASTARRPRRATRRELASLWRLVREHGAMVHEAHFVRALTREDVSRAMREGRCYVADSRAGPTAVAIVQELRDPGRSSRLVAQMVAGTPAGMRELTRSLRAEAKARGLRHASIAAPDTQWRAVRAAGYRRRWPETMFVFERRL